MKYKLDLIINKPRSEVWEAFIDPEKMKDWQPSLMEVSLLGGIQGQPGAETRLTFTEKEQKFTLVERIVYRQDPEYLEQRYENQFATNTVKNIFVEQAQEQTLWITETEYSFTTVIMKLLGPLYKKNLTARTFRDMERFKKMMETV